MFAHGLFVVTLCSQIHFVIGNALYTYHFVRKAELEKRVYIKLEKILQELAESVLNTKGKDGQTYLNKKKKKKKKRINR